MVFKLQRRLILFTGEGMDCLSLLFLGVEKVFQSKDALQHLSEKWDAGKARALSVGKKNGGSVISVAPQMISPEDKDYMTTTKRERKTPN